MPEQPKSCRSAAQAGGHDPCRDHQQRDWGNVDAEQVDLNNFNPRLLSIQGSGFKIGAILG
jgi:hypothetical protein